MTLDAVTKKLEILLAGAVIANQLPFSCAWMDNGASASTPGSNDGVTNGASPVDLVPVPGASTQRVVDWINVQNADTAPATVTLRYNNNGTMRNLLTVTLAVGDVVDWTPHGWQILNNLGQLKATGTSGGLRGCTLLTAASGTYTTPAGVAAIEAECQGPGGGGGGASYLASNCGVGGGGASGGWAKKYIANPAASYAYACPAGGTAGANTGGTGGTGSDCTFGVSIVVAKGGLGGVGTVYGTTVTTALGGDGAASGAVGDYVDYGQPGGFGIRFSGVIGVSGVGGSSIYGKGGNSRNTQGAGNNGTGYGSGGSGALSLSAAAAGGVGGPACILVHEYWA